MKTTPLAFSKTCNTIIMSNTIKCRKKDEHFEMTASKAYFWIKKLHGQNMFEDFIQSNLPELTGALFSLLFLGVTSAVECTRIRKEEDEHFEMTTTKAYFALLFLGVVSTVKS